MYSTSTTRGKLILAGKGTEKKKKKLGKEGEKEKNNNNRNGLSKAHLD